MPSPFLFLAVVHFEPFYTFLLILFYTSLCLLILALTPGFGKTLVCKQEFARLFVYLLKITSTHEAHHSLCHRRVFRRIRHLL